MTQQHTITNLILGERYHFSFFSFVLSISQGYAYLSVSARDERNGDSILTTAAQNELTPILGGFKMRHEIEFEGNEPRINVDLIYEEA